jgi:hypothetical protein
MEHTYEELHKKTVAQLREIADGIDHEKLQGHSTMHKADLLQRLCEVLGVEAHVHHEVVGIDKSKVKAEIRALKVTRDKALEDHDHKKLKEVRREIRGLKRKIKKSTI